MDANGLYLSPENFQTQNHLKTINDWTHGKEMKLNSDKTKYMLVNFCHSSIFQTRLSLDNSVLEQVRETKLLGVTLTDDMKWHKNTENIIRKANKRMSLLHNLVNFNVDKTDAVQIYTLYIRSILEQSCVVWGTSITDAESLALERVQKCALRIIFKNEYISYTNALSMAGLSDLSTRRFKLIHTFAEKCIMNDKTKFMFPIHEQTANTRHSESYEVPCAYHDRLKNSSKVYMANYLTSKYRK